MKIFEYFANIFKKKEADKKPSPEIHTIAGDKEHSLLRYLENKGGDISYIVDKLVKIYDTSHSKSKEEFLDICSELNSSYKEIYSQVEAEWDKRYSTLPKYGRLDSIIISRTRKTSASTPAVKPKTKIIQVQPKSSMNPKKR